MRASTRAFCILSSAAASLSGCANAEDGALGSQDPKSPGEVLGFFAVAGELSDDTCGADSLSAPQKWSFEVKLSRDGSALYWLNGREGIVGEIDKSGNFAFETHLDLPLAERHGAAKGCTIVRSDIAKGALAKSEDALSMKLSYAYATTPDSDCSEFVGASAPTISETTGLPLALPCSMTYTLRGARVSGP